MFDVMRKPWLWDMLDRGLLQAIEKRHITELKTCQDLGAFDYLKDLENKRILEVGGGIPRILPILARRNQCINLDQFDGNHGGPAAAQSMEGIENRTGYLGDFDPSLEPASIDAIFSVSVVEHIPAASLQAFFDDGMRLLASGGLWVHAIDIYVQDEPDESFQRRYSQYREWFSSDALEPLGPVNQGPLRFSCDMVTNPDNVMYAWKLIAPQINDLRQQAQCVTIFVAGTKK